MRPAALLLLLSAALPATQAQKSRRADDPRSGYERADRATVLHTANVYVQPDSRDPAITTVVPGHELVIHQRNGPWLEIFANTDAKDTNPDEEPAFKDPHDPRNQAEPSSGWIRDKGIVSPKTLDGDALLYGDAAELEAAAGQPHPPENAAVSAELLYRRVLEYFPDSPLAPEATFRAADVRWQIEKLDTATLPSAHEQDAYLRPQLYEGDLKRVIKYFPGTPQAARAAFDLLDNKLCGDWQGLARCPEMETELFLKYAQQFPGGPKTDEALYNAAFRQGSLVTLYTADEQTRRATTATQQCRSIADRMKKQFPHSDYTARALSIAFRVEQGIPIFGSDRN